MNLVVDAIQGVLTILLMISVGYTLARRGWFSEEISSLLSRLVLLISLPAMMVSNFVGTFDKKTILDIGPGMLVPLGTILLSYLLAAGLSLVLRIPRSRRGLFRAHFALSNTIFVGLPVNVALFGEASVPFVTLYYLINTTIFWTIGVYFIRRDAEVESARLFSAETLKRIFTPVFVAFVFSILLVLYEIKLPKFIMNSLKYAANLTTPLSMLIIGITIQGIGLRGIKINREMTAVLLGRFVVTPAVAWTVMRFIEVPDLMRKVFLVVAAMPVMTQIALVSKAYDADHRTASVMTTVTTLASLLVIPCYMLLFA